MTDKGLSNIRKDKKTQLSDEQHRVLEICLSAYPMVDLMKIFKVQIEPNLKRACFNH
jgi:hypothetical protein